MDITTQKFIDTLESNVSFDGLDFDSERTDSSEYMEFRGFESEGELV